MLVERLLLSRDEDIENKIHYLTGNITEKVGVKKKTTVKVKIYSLKPRPSQGQYDIY